MSKSALFSWYFHGHVRRRARRHFSAVYVEGAEQLRVPKPLILFCNHSAWWDSLFCFLLTWGRDTYALMDQAGLDKHPYLGWIGGFGVKRGDKEDGKRALNYAAELLKQPRIVVIFPQGREQPHALRPLGFKPGLERLMAMTGADAIPMAIRYEHGKHEKPFAVISIGPPTKTPEAAMLERLARLDDLMTERFEELSQRVVERLW